MSLSGGLADVVQRLLDRHEALGAVSADARCATPCYHAMADGKYLSALAVARRLRLLDEESNRRHVLGAVARLSAHNFVHAAGQACWGLGFPHGHTDEREPFLITSAVVTHGLFDNESAVEPALLSAAVRWLDEYRWRQPVSVGGVSVQLPQFSPTTSTLVTNAVACWAAAVYRAGARAGTQGQRGPLRAGPRPSRRGRERRATENPRSHRPPGSSVHRARSAGGSR